MNVDPPANLLSSPTFIASPSARNVASLAEGDSKQLRLAAEEEPGTAMPLEHEDLPVHIEILIKASSDITDKDELINYVTPEVHNIGLIFEDQTLRIFEVWPLCICCTHGELLDI